jgi:hypothetical protein
MPRVFRKQYSYPIPEDAKRVKVKDRKGRTYAAVRFEGPEGKTVTAPLTQKGDRCRIFSPTWYGWVDGQAVPLCANKAASEEMLGQLLGKAGRGKVGPRDPFEAHRLRPLAEHLDDFRRELGARDNAPRYVALVVSRLQSLLDGCGFQLIADLSASRTADWLADLRRKGRVDRSHDRRELQAEELRRLLHVARTNVAVFRGLTGPDRFHLYVTAAGTGFRASAIASLAPESFDLDAELPTVTLPARHAKNRRAKVQPLPADMADSCEPTSSAGQRDSPSGAGRGPGTARGPRCCGSISRRPGSPTPSRGPTVPCSPTSMPCGTPT